MTPLQKERKREKRRTEGEDREIFPISRVIGQKRDKKRRKTRRIAELLQAEPLYRIL